MIEAINPGHRNLLELAMRSEARQTSPATTPGSAFRDQFAQLFADHATQHRLAQVLRRVTASVDEESHF
jgi:hypothetical protein